jgi:hypothetical protein
MYTFYCRAMVGVYDPTTKHSYGERKVSKCVEAIHLEEATQNFREWAMTLRFPILPAITTVHFLGATQIGGRNTEVGVLPYPQKKRR